MYQTLLTSYIGQFSPEREIKRTEKGTVTLLRDASTGERMIYRVFFGSGEAYEKLRSLRCPYLPRVYAVREEQGRVDTLEEYICGDKLSMVLAGGPLSEEQARKIALQLCQALQALHSAGIVHRDIKPENILLRQDEAVLIDFDTSRLIKARSTTDTQIMGTTGYAAPEQYGFSQTDARADIYAFGVLLNEMLTGQHPAKRLAEGPLKPVIEKCIEVNVDKRYRTVKELTAALQPEKQKRRTFLYTTATLVLAAVAFAGGFLLAGKGPAEPEPAAQIVEVPAVEVLTHDPLTVSDEKKIGITVPYTTSFLYDLDGDGEKEIYQFGVYIEGLPDLPFIVTNDSVWPFGDAAVSRNRTVYPCVWRTVSDGSVEQVMEFADLLENGQTKLWRVTNLECEAPAVFTADSNWKGGLQVEFFYTEHEGSWLYETSATLAGVQLTGQAMTHILLEDPNP